MSEVTFTLEELAEESGFDKRVIRSFIENGLLLGPDSRGRYARYGPGHLARLKAIRNLRERQSLSFNEVRQALMGMSDEDIRTLAEPPPTPTAGGRRLNSVLEYLDTVKAGISGYSRDYAGNILDAASTVEEDQTSTLRGGFGREQRPGFAQAGAEPGGAIPAASASASASASDSEVEWKWEPRNSAGSPVDRLLLALASLTTAPGSKGQSRGEVLHRFNVTPDIEISIRNLSDASQIERWGRICDALREILLGGGQ